MYVVELTGSIPNVFGNQNGMNTVYVNSGTAKISEKRMNV
jgi:hypothetical protein